MGVGEEEEQKFLLLFPQFWLAENKAGLGAVSPPIQWFWEEEEEEAAAPPLTTPQGAVNMGEHAEARLSTLVNSAQ